MKKSSAYAAAIRALKKYGWQKGDFGFIGDEGPTPMCVYGACSYVVGGDPNQECCNVYGSFRHLDAFAIQLGEMHATKGSYAATYNDRKETKLKDVIHLLRKAEYAARKEEGTQ